MPSGVGIRLWSIPGGGGGGGAFSSFQVTGMIEGFFWVSNFRFQDFFLGKKIRQVFFWGDLF